MNLSSCQKEWNCQSWANLSTHSTYLLPKLTFFFSFLLMFYFHFMHFDHSDIEYQGILQIWQIGILHQTTSPMYFNPLQGDVERRRQTNIFLLFQKLSKIKFSLPYWIQHEKCIQMSTNKPSIGVVVLEIAIQILTFSNTNL